MKLVPVTRQNPGSRPCVYYLAMEIAGHGHHAARTPKRRTRR